LELLKKGKNTMANSRLLLMSLGLVLVLGIAGLGIMSLSGPDNSAPTPSGNNNVAPDANNTPNNNSTTPTTTPSTPQPNTSGPSAPANPMLYCPQQTELYKKEMFWYGPNSWRDYSASFVKTINNFSGAQWVGVNVGKIICLYKGVGEDNFPVAIERDNLMKKPDGEHWKSDPSGYQICKSDNMMDCPFSPQEIQSNEEVYDFLKDIKKK
jgi:hypothetical protein